MELKVLIIAEVYKNIWKQMAYDTNKHGYLHTDKTDKTAVFFYIS